MITVHKKIKKKISVKLSIMQKIIFAWHFLCPLTEYENLHMNLHQILHSWKNTLVNVSESDI